MPRTQIPGRQTTGPCRGGFRPASASSRGKTGTRQSRRRSLRKGESSDRPCEFENASATSNGREVRAGESPPPGSLIPAARRIASEQVERTRFSSRSGPPLQDKSPLAGRPAHRSRTRRGSCIERSSLRGALHASQGEERFDEQRRRLRWRGSHQADRSCGMSAAPNRPRRGAARHPERLSPRSRDSPGGCQATQDSRGSAVPGAHGVNRTFNLHSSTAAPNSR